MFKLIIASLIASAFTLSSPDGRLVANVESYPNRVEYTLSCDGQALIDASPVSLNLSGESTLPQGRLLSAKTRSNDTVFDTPYYRKAQVRDHFNELKLAYKGGSVVFRLYDDAFAWRFEAAASRPYNVLSEQACFNFAQDWNMYAGYTHKYEKKGLEAQYCDDFENVYAHTPISEWNREHFAFCPLMVEGPGGVKMVITESDLISYPGLFLYNEDGGHSLVGRNAPVPDSVRVAGHNRLQELVVTRKGYIAECDGAARTFPWRVVCISHEDRQMADNDAVMRLAGSPEPGMDFSWVRPGRVAWDWLNAWGLKGMDFKAGVNTQTYKYYIDFASRNSLEYVILDEGWAVKYKNDLFRVIPELDLDEVLRYAASKNVGIFLWAGHHPFDKDMEKVCEYYSAKGVKGFKVDFMDRDDQKVENFMLKAAKVCAKYKMLLDFHGTHKPVGLQRRYPNVINCEGIFGLEQMRGHDLPEFDMVKTDVTIPFVRYVAGFADYTPGFMRNASKENFRPVRSEPMSQGTRCRQLAEYVVFDAPLNMLADSPTNYEKEPECLEYIRAVPTVWDETRVIDGKVGEYIITARRKGDVWFVGAMTDWTARDIIVDAAALLGGDFLADCYVDGFIAEKIASDFRRISVGGSDPIAVHMAPGGGFAAIIRKK